MTSLLLKLWKLLPLSKSLQLNLMRLLQDQFLVGVAGVILNDKNDVLLFKHTYRQMAWGLPGGYLKGREHPREGLEREILEESGLVVSADKRVKIRTDRETARLEICYIGTFIGGKFTPSGEVKEAKFFSFDTLPLIPKDQMLLVAQALKMHVREAQKPIQKIPNDRANPAGFWNRIIHQLHKN